jgi:hypothetical protein
MNQYKIVLKNLITISSQYVQNCAIVCVCISKIAFLQNSLGFLSLDQYFCYLYIKFLLNI